MDQQKLRSLVFDKTGVRIDIDDPIFALVALNEAVLAEAVERHVALLDDATRRAQAALPRAAVAGNAAAPPATAPGVAAAERRMLAVAVGAAVLGALLVLGGQALLFKPAAPPAPLVQARELTPAQASALEHGEKLAKAVRKLDRKARDTIEAEMAQP